MEIKNKKAYFNYEIIDKIEAGIELKGTEVKSIRNGKAQLSDSYAIIKKGEVLLLNLNISSYEKGNIFNHDELRTRKLLLHKKEILKLEDKVKKEGYSLIPLKLYFNKRNVVKIMLGIGKGKKLYDKRESLKKKEQERELRKNYRR